MNVPSALTQFYDLHRTNPYNVGTLDRDEDGTVASGSENVPVPTWDSTVARSSADWARIQGHG